jgi:thioredoxin-like negative regulator of GroEL
MDKNYVKEQVMKLTLFSATLAAPMILATAILAAENRAFDQSAFNAAQAQGRPIIVEVHAPWCPVCAAQVRAMKRITADKRYDGLITFRIDYDTQQPIWKKFGAQKQATLIAYKGKQETGRLSYVTDEAKIGALLASTLD